MNDYDYAKIDVENAYRVLELALRLKSFLENGHGDLSVLGGCLEIESNVDIMKFTDDFFLERNNVNLVAQYSVGAAFGVSAVALTNFYEVARHIHRPDEDGAIKNMWCLIYAIRNAFAHGIANPIWLVKQQYRKAITLELEDSIMEIDLKILHGNEFTYEHIGGIGNWYKIKSKSFELLANDS